MPVIENAISLVQFENDFLALLDSHCTVTDEDLDFLASIVKEKEFQRDPLGFLGIPIPWWSSDRGDLRVTSRSLNQIARVTYLSCQSGQWGFLDSLRFPAIHSTECRAVFPCGVWEHQVDQLENAFLTISNGKAAILGFSEVLRKMHEEIT